MKVKSLEISRIPSYDTKNPNMLMGIVHFEGPNGEAKVALSNKALSDIFKVITDEVVATGKDNANRLAHGMENAAHEHLIIEATNTELML